MDQMYGICTYSMNKKTTQLLGFISYTDGGTMQTATAIYCTLPNYVVCHSKYINIKCGKRSFTTYFVRFVRGENATVINYSVTKGQRKKRL